MEGARRSREFDEEAFDRYEAERWQHMAATPEARQRLDADACHDVSVDLRVGPEVVAAAIERASGQRVNRSLL